MLRMESLLRLLGELLVVAFVSMMMATKVSQNWDYWWIAAIVTGVIMVARAIVLLSSEHMRGE